MKRPLIKLINCHSCNVEPNAIDIVYDFNIVKIAIDLPGFKPSQIKIQTMPGGLHIFAKNGIETKKAYFDIVVPYYVYSAYYKNGILYIELILEE